MNIQVIVLTADDPGCLDRLPAELTVPDGVCVADGLRAALNWTAVQVEAAFKGRAVAVFGVTARPDDVLHDGDRIEVLDALRHDPMESRRRRARHKAVQPKSRRRQSP